MIRMYVVNSAITVAIALCSNNTADTVATSPPIDAMDRKIVISAVVIGSIS